MIDSKFSGVLHPSDETLKYFQESIDRTYYESMKALRLFFLMKFKMPFRCAVGDKTFVHYGNKKMYKYNGDCFAVEDYSQEHYLRSTLTSEEMYEWMKNMPMKKFKMFGKCIVKSYE